MSVFKSVCIALTSIMMFYGCTSSRLSADELKYLSNRTGLEITNQDNVDLYKQVSGWLGVKYRSGGTTKSGVDCSGFVGAIYRDVYGKKLCRTVEDIYANNCKRISKARLKEGDLLFFRTDGKRKRKPNHVGIYLKDGKFVHASSSKGVVINNISTEYYVNAFMCGGRVK